MKSVCKKFLMALLVTVLLFNFIMNPFSFAGSDAVRDAITGLLGTFVGVITWIPRVIALGIGYAIDALAAGIAYVDGATQGNNIEAFITPFEIVFNKAAIIDINFFDFTGVGQDTVIYKIRNAVAGWYYFMRLIAVSILLVILVYVGIRMAITTVAEDKAKFKKMLVDWVSSLALVFLLQYIMIFIITLNEVLVDAMASVCVNNDLGDAINKIAGIALEASIEGIGATVVFFLFVIQTFMILFSYINRMIRIAFLIIIAPLITITYSLDKMGDGKAQALNTWLKDFITSVLIQPFHCVIYMVFVSVAIGLLTDPSITGTSQMAAAVVAILCMLFIKDAEKIVRKIFALDGDDNASSIAAGAAIAGAALHKSKDIGKSVRQGVNAAKEMKPIQKTKEAFTSMKNGVKATAKSISDGKNGPGLAANYNMYAAESQKKQEERTQRKEQRKQERQDRRMEKHYLAQNKQGSAAEQRENRQAVMQKAKEYQKNGMKGPDALRKARAEVARENIKKGKFKDTNLNRARSTVRAVSQSNIGKYMKSQVSIATGIVTGSMALQSENIFQAAGFGIATANATTEFMNSSNNYIADEAAQYAQNITSGDVNTSEGIQMVVSQAQSGKLEKDQEKAEEAITDALRNLTDKDGNPLSEDRIQNILANMRVGLGKNPGADLEQILSECIDKSVADIQAELNGIGADIQNQLNTGMNDLRNSTNKMGLAQTIQNGTQYGASVETLADRTIHRMGSGTVAPGDDRAIESLYSANESMEKVELSDAAMQNLISQVQNAGYDLKHYIDRMEKNKARLVAENKPENQPMIDNYTKNIAKFRNIANIN